MTLERWQNIADHFRRSCETAGLDLVWPFAAKWCEPLELDLGLETFAHRNPLGLLIGNSRALWPHVLRRCSARSLLPDHPVDEHCRETVELAIQGVGVATTARWAQDMTPPVLPIQRIAEKIGFAELSPVHLSVHPRFGPWLALRAVVMCDVPAPPGPPPALASHCARCEQPCLPLLSEALAVDPKDARGHLRWLAVRQACPVGRAWHYGPGQVRYHYTKDRAMLPTQSTTKPDTSDTM